jgi:tetratricopeptide (TPR) repeat protein
MPIAINNNISSLNSCMAFGRQDIDWFMPKQRYPSKRACSRNICSVILINTFKEAQYHYERITTTPGAHETQGDMYHGTLVAMTHTHNQLNNYQEFERWAQRATEDLPHSIQGWYQWGKALMHLNQSEAALEKTSRALVCKHMISSVQMDYSNLRIFCMEEATAILVYLNRHQETKNILGDALKKEAAPRISEFVYNL